MAARQGIIGERTGANAKLGEPGASKGEFPGTACSVPGKEVVPPGRRGFQRIRRRFPRRTLSFFRVPCLGSQSYGRRFFRRWNITVAHGDFFRIPGQLGSAVERLTLCRQVSGSSLAYCRRFFPFSFSYGIRFDVLFFSASSFLLLFYGIQSSPPPCVGGWGDCAWIVDSRIVTLRTDTVFSAVYRSCRRLCFVHWCCSEPQGVFSACHPSVRVFAFANSLNR